MKRLHHLVLLTFIIFFTAFPKGASGQIGDPLIGTVKDESGQSLSYVNIGIVGTTVGTVSGPDGSFTLYLAENISEKDTLRFSMVGHGNQSFSVKDFFEKKEKEIVLPATSMGLPEVVVRPQFLNKKQIGMDRTSTKRFNNFAISNRPNQNLGAEIGRKFNLPNGEVQLDTFQFYVASNNFDTVRLRINIYAIKKGKPDQNIAPSNIIVELTDRQKGWIKVDLTPYQFTLTENIAVTVEWIYHSVKGSALALPIAMPSMGIHYYKHGSQGEWKTFPGMSTAMSLEVSYKGK